MGLRSLSIDVGGCLLGSGTTVADLEQIIQGKYPSVSGLTYKIAINGRFVESEIQVPEAASIAMLPPFAGG